MVTSVHSSISRQLFATFLVILSATTIRAETTPVPTSQKELQEIDSAWKARTDQIQSLTMRIDMQEFIKGGGGKRFKMQKDSLFNEPRPETGRVFDVAFEYAFKQGKATLMRSGPVIDPRDPEKTSEQKIQDTFDGRECRSLCQQTGFPLVATVEKRNSPTGSIIQNADLAAIHLWMQPDKALPAFFAEKVTRTVEEKSVDVDGVSCRRIRFTSDKGTRNVTLDVDPQRAWLPLQWEVGYGRPKSQLSMNLTIKYGNDAKAGPVVKSWVYTSFNPNGEFDQIRKAKVAAYQVNGSIDDSRFTIAFPAGTRVSEIISETESRSYIQKATGLVPDEDDK